MNRKLKGCLIFLTIIILAVVIIIGGIYYNLITSKEREINDRMQCEKTDFITEKPLIIIEKKSDSIIDQINVSIQRNNIIIKNVLLKQNIGNRKNYFSFNIPFKKFKNTDVIIIETKYGKYKISGFNNSLKSHWVMFGYNGGECSLDYSRLKINDQNYNGNLLQEEEYERNKILLPYKQH